MKGKILLLFFLVFSIAFGQRKTYSIDWEASRVMGFGNNKLTLPSFNDPHYSFDFDKGLLFVAQWEISGHIDESSVKLTNVKYQPIPKKDLYELDVNTIKRKLQFNFKNATARDKRYAFFSFSPIIEDANGNYKKVVSFQLNYSTNPNGQNKGLNTKKNSSSRAITNSVLSTGEWYRFYVDTTGVFRLSKAFLQDLGVNVNSIDPRNIKVYGNGGAMIPYANAAPYPLDISENAIKVVGEEDGRFDDDDHILFYAQGPRGYNQDSNTNINVYTDKTYYYVNIGAGPGKRIQPFLQPSGPADIQVNTFQDYQFHEKDIHNIGTLGRRWFGERFNIESEQTFKFSFPDLVIAEPIQLKVFAASVSTSRASMEIRLNGTEVDNLSFSALTKLVIGNGRSHQGSHNVSASDIEVTLEYDNQGNPGAQGYLDFISIEATRDLRFYGKQFQFKNNDIISVPGIAEYTISGATGLSEVWDVTDLNNISNLQNTENADVLTFKAAMGNERIYVALSHSDYFQPKSDGNKTVANQDIKGTILQNDQGEFQDLDYLIVAPNNMLTQAERLAQINRRQYNITAKVVGLNEIYNEFSTGNQDIGAIRNLVKYIYDNASAPDKRIKYLCLFGDGSYDYKDRIPNNTNIVPSWHSYNSFSLTGSYISDDFYGMMDGNEGAMSTGDLLDIAVGRILADTPQRAKDLVDKIEAYHSKESFGSWRNSYVVVSDDVDIDWEDILQETTDDVGDSVEQNKPFINVVKVHMDAFQQESSAGGESYPKANEAFINAINNGALVVNYFGHGGEEGLASERILLKPDIEDFRNLCRLNCFVTVTCEFTKFDNPFRQTAGELTYWKKQTGAIGLISTTRQVFVNFGVTFNRLLGQYLFSFSGTSGIPDNEYPTMAEALRLTKNNPRIAISGQRRLVFFIGDPAMKLAFPKPNVRLTKINDTPIAQATDTLKALSRIKLSGEITDAGNNLLGNYSGKVSTTIYDKFIQRQTLANDNTRDSQGIIKLDFKTLGEIIFRGQASVTNGQFEFEFVVPKDISIPVGLGKVSFYAQNGQVLEDQTGANLTDVKIGGINENAETDNTGPVITIYMNDENFVSGGITNESPTLLAKLEDANGINTASGIGHDIVAVIDGDETNPFVLNDYYETELDNFQKGTVSFPFRDLEPGLHTLTLKAWDVYNNSSVSEIQFVVFDKDQELVIDNVLNYPNPFVDYTEFWFNHNSSEPLDVSIQIFTVSGKLVRTLNGQTSGGVKTTSSVSKDVIWDGRDDFGDKIGKGVYVYKLTVKSNLLNKKVEKIEKLVIL